MSRINEALRRWNGREVASLTRLVTAGLPRPGEVDALIDFVAVGSERERTGATWLLLASARCGEQLSVSQTTAPCWSSSMTGNAKGMPWENEADQCKGMHHLAAEIVNRGFVAAECETGATLARDKVVRWGVVVVPSTVAGRRVRLPTTGASGTTRHCLSAPGSQREFAQALVPARRTG